MEIRVDGKVLVVTGGNQGLGRAVAVEAAPSAASGVLKTGRDEKRGAEAAAEIEALGVASIFVPADLEADAPEQIVATPLDRFGWTKNSAYAHRFDRIRVNGINLGWADTPGERTMQGEKLRQGEGRLANAEAIMPWGRLIKPEDVARLPICLLSTASIPMTGSLIDQEQNYVLGVRD